MTNETTTIEYVIRCHCYPSGHSSLLRRHGGLVLFSTHAAAEAEAQRLRETNDPSIYTYSAQPREANAR